MDEAWFNRVLASCEIVEADEITYKACEKLRLLQVKIPKLHHEACRRGIALMMTCPELDKRRLAIACSVTPAQFDKSLRQAENVLFGQRPKFDMELAASRYLDGGRATIVELARRLVDAYRPLVEDDATRAAAFFDAARRNRSDVDFRDLAALANVPQPDLRRLCDDMAHIDVSTTKRLRFDDDDDVTTKKASRVATVEKIDVYDELDGFDAWAGRVLKRKVTSDAAVKRAFATYTSNLPPTMNRLIQLNQT